MKASEVKVGALTLGGAVILAGMISFWARSSYLTAGIICMCPIRPSAVL